MFKAKWKETWKIPKSMKSNFLNITLEKYENKCSIKCIRPYYNWNCPIFYQIEEYVKNKKNNDDYWQRKGKIVFYVVRKGLMLFTVFIYVNDMIVYIFHFLFRTSKELINFLDNTRKPFLCWFLKKVTLDGLN